LVELVAGASKRASGNEGSQQQSGAPADHLVHAIDLRSVRLQCVRDKLNRCSTSPEVEPASAVVGAASAAIRERMGTDYRSRLKPLLRPEGSPLGGQKP